MTMDASRRTIEETDGPSVDVAEVATQLLDVSAAIAPADLLATNGARLLVPGLYSWWIDEAGAEELSSSLGVEVRLGLIYVGLAGATRWPSGKPSSSTLWSRIAGMHLGNRHEYSTLRRTLGAVLANARHQPVIDEEALTAWMYKHLKVVAVPFEDPNALGRLKQDVLVKLDPPLNLMGMQTSPVRARVKELRRPHR